MVRRRYGVDVSPAVVFLNPDRATLEMLKN